MLRGPNQWARFPVLEVRVDLGWLEEYPSHTLAGFNERLMNWLPTMIEHRCSIVSVVDFLNDYALVPGWGMFLNM